MTRVAVNDGSTEGVRNAFRMAANLISRYQIDRDDLGDDHDTASVRYARGYVFLNGLRRTRWEEDLASFIVSQLCPSCDIYRDVAFDRNRNTDAHCVSFFGPADDVEFCTDVFRELVVTIPAMAKLRGLRGFARGEGATYCAGFVGGLHEAAREATEELSRRPGGTEMISLSKSRALALSESAKDWLDESEGIQLVSCRKLRGSMGPTAAYFVGVDDGRRCPVQAKVACPT